MIDKRDKFAAISTTLRPREFQAGDNDRGNTDDLACPRHVALINSPITASLFPCRSPPSAESFGFRFQVHTDHGLRPKSGKLKNLLGVFLAIDGYAGEMKEKGSSRQFGTIFVWDHLRSDKRGSINTQLAGTGSILTHDEYQTTLVTCYLLLAVADWI